MAHPFDTPGRLERRIAAGMADQSGDSSLGLGMARGASSIASMSLSTSASWDEMARPASSVHQQRQRGSIRSRGSYADHENSAPPSRLSGEMSKSASSSRRDSPLKSVLGERSTNSAAQRPTLAKAVASSLKESREVANHASNASIGQLDVSKAANNSAAVAASLSASSYSSQASSSDVRVRSPPLTSTPHPSRGMPLQPSSTGQRSIAHSQSSPPSQRYGSTSQYSASSARLRKLSERDTASGYESSLRTNSGGFRSAVEESRDSVGASRGGSGISGASRTAEHQQQPHVVGTSRNSAASSNSGSDGSIGRGDGDARDRSQDDTKGTLLLSDLDPPAPAPQPELPTAPAAEDDLASETSHATVERMGTKSSAEDHLATPTTAKVNQEQMKTYFLSAVKAVNPLREMQLRHMTPRPARIQSSERVRTTNNALLPPHLRPAANIPDDASPSYAESTHSDASSTRDLTVPAHLNGRGNSSLPDTGPDISATGGARVDAARLQGYLHKINTQLEGENVALREEHESLRRQFDRALLDNEKLRKQLDASKQGLVPNLSPRLPSQAVQTQTEIARTDLSREMIELRAGNDELNKILDERDAEVETLKSRLEACDEDHVRGRIADLESELDEERQSARAERERFDAIIQEARAEADNALATSERHSEQERSKLRAEVENLKALAKRSYDSSQNADGEDEAGRLRHELHWTNVRLEDANGQLNDALNQIEQMEHQLAEKHDIQVELENYVEDHMAAISELEAELVEIKGELEACSGEAEENKDKAVDLGIVVEEKNSDIIRLEMLLRQAQNSPDIVMLREKVTLLESQLHATRESATLKRTDAPAATTGSTPVHPSIAALRKPVETPRSPAELSSMSWLYQESTLGEKAVLRDIQALRGQVDAAQAATDDIISKLSASQMAEKIVELHMVLEHLQEDRERHGERESRWRRRIERIRCGQCKTKISGVDLDTSFDATVTMTGDVTTSSKSARSSNKEQVLADVAHQLNELKANWAVDRAKLAADREALEEARKVFDSERAHLQEENRRLKNSKDAKTREVREQAKRMQENTLHDLSRARRIIGEFERELRDDCERFQQALRSSHGADQETAEVERELERTKAKLAAVDGELKEKVATFEQLEMELFETSQMDSQLPMQVHRLEMEVRRFSSDVERLREERNLILKERQTLFVRRRKSQKEFVNVYEELRSAREAIGAHQRQLDEQVETIERLHETLRAQSKTLEAAHDDRDRLHKQRHAILNDVAHLEADLRRVRDESKHFGADLEALRQAHGMGSNVASQPLSAASSAEDMLRLRKQYQAEVARMVEEATTRDAAQRAQHYAQCQGLLLQIRYEKAKFMRESDLRADLIHQKRYILGILGGLELGEEATVRFLADLQQSRKNTSGPFAGVSATKHGKHVRVHHPHQSTCTSKAASAALGRWRAAGWAVVAVCRARIMARNWRQTTNVKRALREAHGSSKAEGHGATT